MNDLIQQWLDEGSSQEEAESLARAGCRPSDFDLYDCESW